MKANILSQMFSRSLEVFFTSTVIFFCFTGSVLAYSQKFNTWAGTCENFCVSQGYESSQIYGYIGGNLTGCSTCTMGLGEGAPFGPWSSNYSDCSYVGWGWTPQCATQCVCTSAIAPLPDLTAQPASPVTAVEGTPASFSALVRNIGGVSTSINFPIFFQVATTVNGGGVVTDLASSFLPILTAGGSTTASYASYAFPSSGTYSIRVCADKVDRNDSGIITEADEGNNCGAWTNVVVSGVIVTTGSITPSNCTIVAGTTCTASIAWTTSNVSSPIIKNNGVTFSTLPSSAGFPTTLFYGLNTLKLFDGTTSLYTAFAFGLASDQGAGGPSCGGSFTSQPTTGLCASGTISPVVPMGSGWGWTCGTGVGLIACSATKTSACGNGACEVNESFLSCPKDCGIKKFYQF